MPKRSRKAKTKPVIITPESDPNQTAFAALQHLLDATEREGGKNPLAVALGRLGGLKGGHARAAKLTPQQRRRSAVKAANARWKNKIKP